MEKYLLLVLSLFMLSGCSDDLFQKSNTEDELHISAAMSLTNVMDELVESYKKVDPDTKITLNFDSSGKLAQQIQQGAPTDIFLSADQEWMDMLDEQELIASGTRTNFATNELVLIANKNHPFTIDSLNELPSLAINQIAIGDPDSVAAGSYTKEALQQANIWGAPLLDKFIYEKDVHQVLADVQSGSADAGFVYASDMSHVNNVDVILEVDNDLHEDIVYPAGVTSYSEYNKQARDFISFLKSDQGVSILQSYGFNK
ncbi:molybdate transport system substrate-binding protein [Virgibacillus halotolerans]|uniref:molybdate ABC transporter substrate-binding protein n=1 Tax=Virgibacillus halotolerans TaxID=1071053 RepID=UPI00195FB11B|nr:molybdate ABC transporter substrate-binding protein [Virgibacillus halotolerans]MBM7601379.1 molybdate transport system substrate-binding protein [Virgibacillus halotolerans]